MRNYLSELSMSLLESEFTIDEVKRIVDIATKLSCDFDIAEKSTSLVTCYGSVNDRILKTYTANKILEG